MKISLLQGRRSKSLGNRNFDKGLFRRAAKEECQRVRCTDLKVVPAIEVRGRVSLGRDEDKEEKKEKRLINK